MKRSVRDVCVMLRRAFVDLDDGRTWFMVEVVSRVPRYVLGVIYNVEFDFEIFLVRIDTFAKCRKLIELQILSGSDSSLVFLAD